MLLPGVDPVTMLIEMVPLLVLFELSILLAAASDAVLRGGRRCRGPARIGRRLVGHRQTLMLFDLQGKRRRVVQVDVRRPGLPDGRRPRAVRHRQRRERRPAATRSSATTAADDAATPASRSRTRSRPPRSGSRRTPSDQAALSTLVRAHFGLAGLEQEEQDGPGRLTEEGRKEMQKADAAWARYIATDPERIDPGLAATALADLRRGSAWARRRTSRRSTCCPRARSPSSRTPPRPTSSLSRWRRVAGDTRTAGLAERKALSFAQTKDDRSHAQGADRDRPRRRAALQQRRRRGGAATGGP